MKRLPLLYMPVLFAVLSFSVSAQNIIDLYNNGPVPNSKPCSQKETLGTSSSGKGAVSNVIRPTLQVFTAAVPNASAASIIICPGGGYAGLAIEHEGYDVAKALNAMGITAF